MQVFEFPQDEPLHIVGEATYRSYQVNRQRSPAITPEQWMLVYGQAVEAMEARYQQELTKGANV